MKQKGVNILVGLFLVVGIGFLCYPALANWWNQMHQSYAIASYMEVIKAEKIDYEALRYEAIEYNKTLVGNVNRWSPNEEEKKQYEKLLDAAENGIIGCIEIPKINVSLPIYHGTEESVLQIAVGHMEGSSMPVGGETSHAVLSAHTGLPSAKLFTNLDQMEEGDYFVLQVLNETLTYQVDQIVVVDPKEMEYLAIEEGKDYCTLLTCTPYGINTHRLLVRGRRVENLTEPVVECVSSQEIYVKSGFVLVVIIGIIIVGVVFLKFRRST